MKPRHLILVGFMGTGKTTVGELIHKKTGYFWIDTDKRLETIWGMNISCFFSHYGEEAFREQERMLLAKLFCSPQPCIVSTGGGIVLREENRRMMKKNGKTVCLTADVRTIIQRVKHLNDRPLLEGNVERKVQRLYTNRQGLYDFADLTLDTSCLTCDSVADEIISFWNMK